jgi:hypothetical protein
MRPKQAPTASVGTKTPEGSSGQRNAPSARWKGAGCVSPAGSLIPKVITVKSPLSTIATAIAQIADRISLGFETQR